MADTKLSALTEVTDLATTDQFYTNDAGVSKRVTLLNLAKGINNANGYYNILEHGFTGDDATDNSTSLNTLITTIEAAGGGTIVVPMAADDFLLAGSSTSNATVNWLFLGGILHITGDLTINGSVTSIPFHQQCFEVATAATEALSKLKIEDASNSGVCSPTQGPMSSEWFDGTNDMGQRVNKGFAAGGDNTWVMMPPGEYTTATQIDMQETSYGQDMRLSGTGHVSTSLKISNGSDIIGVNLHQADECLIEDFRVFYDLGGGGRQSCGINFGGQNTVMRNIWLGAELKYGIINNDGGGCLVNNLTIEQCDIGILIASYFTDFDLTNTPEGNNPSTTHWTNVIIAACGNSAFDEELAGLVIANFNMITMTGASGDFTVGATLTGDSSGRTATIKSYNGSNKVIVTYTAQGQFSGGEGVTASSGGTGTISVQNTQTVGDQRFTNFRTENCTRHGVEIGGTGGIVTDIMFDTFWIGDNGGSLATGENSVRSAGMKIMEDAEVQLCNGSFDGNKGSPAIGLDIIGATTEVETLCHVQVSNCYFTNRHAFGTNNQEDGVRSQDATVMLSNCLFADQATNNVNNANTNKPMIIKNCRKEYSEAIETLANDATPSVDMGEVFLTGGTTTITDFDDGYVGQVITIISEHAITITDGTNIFLNGSANFTMAATDTLTLIQKADGLWYELSRSDNT